MAANGDIIQVLFKQRQQDQQVNMVFHYALEGIGQNSDLEVIMNGWAAVMFPAVNQLQHEFISNVGYEAENLTNGVELAQNSVVGGGAIFGGDIMPPFVAAGIRLNRFSRITRNGQKRLGGLPENAVINGALANDWKVAFNANLATLFAFGFQLTAAPLDGLFFKPRIVGRNAQGGLDLTRVQRIQSVTLNPNASSQVSRKA